MKALLVTDTHLNFNDSTYKIWEQYLNQLKGEDFDIVIHTGDWISHKQSQWNSVLNLFRNFTDKPIVGVKGNHDLWQQPLPKNKRTFDTYMWDKGMYEREFVFHFKTFKELKDFQRQMWTKYRVMDLSLAPFIRDDVYIIGWDGWYRDMPLSNDFSRMPRIESDSNLAMHEFLNRRAHKAFGEVLRGIETGKRMGKKVIVVTHHSLFNYRGGYSDMIGNPTYFEFIKKTGADVFCYGHSHLRDERVVQNEQGKDLRIFNAGSDYNSPNHIIFEI